jgi:catecholate siderophore receptor
MTFALGDNTNLVAQYSYDNDERVTDRGIPSFNDGNAATIDGPLQGYDSTFFGSRDFNFASSENHIARLRLEHEFTDTLSFNVSGQFADYDKYYANVVPTGTDGTTASLGGYASGTDRQNWIGQANLVWDTELGGIGHTFLAGIEYGDQDTYSDRYGVDFGSGAGSITVALDRVLAVPAVQLGALTRASSSQLETFSAYAQEQLDFGMLELVAGLRYDRFDLTSQNLVSNEVASRVDEEVSPRIGLILKPQETLSIYASYSTSFLPQSGDQFTTLSSGDAALEPEKFENLEAGVKWSIKPDLFATASLFRLDRSNTTATDPLNPGLVVLTGSSRVEGFELSLVGKVTPFWQTSFGYTYLDGEIRSDTERATAGQRLQQLPEHQISFWNRFDLNEKFGIGAGIIYQDEQLASISGNVVLPDYVRVDAAAFYTVSDRVSLQLNIENLFDESYYPSAHGDNNIQPGDPFSAKIGVRIEI